MSRILVLDVPQYTHVCLLLQIMMKSWWNTVWLYCGVHAVCFKGADLARWSLMLTPSILYVSECLCIWFKTTVVWDSGIPTSQIRCFVSRASGFLVAWQAHARIQRLQADWDRPVGLKEMAWSGLNNRSQTADVFLDLPFLVDGFIMFHLCIAFWADNHMWETEL